jgi:hypothetical protein
MKTSFSVKVTGSFTVSIESPSNEDGDGGDANDGGSILVDVLLKSLVNDAVKKYARGEGKHITAAEEEEEEEEEEDDLSSPIPKRRIPADADDSVEEEEEEASADEEEEEEEASADEEEEDDDEAGDLPNVQIEYKYADDHSLSQKMNTLNLRRRH